MLVKNKKIRNTRKAKILETGNWLVLQTDHTSTYNYSMEYI